MDNYKRVQELLNDLRLDAILISNMNNVRYISGYAGDTGYLFISQKRHALLTDFRYTYQAEREALGYEIITIGDHGYEEAINEMLRTDQIDTLGFEANDLLYAKYQGFKDKLEVKELIPIKDEVTRLRRIKTPQELEYLKQAEAIGDKVFSEILDFIKPGMTELEVAARIEYLLKTKGGQGLSFHAIVASGINSSMPHAVPTQKKIEVGDFLTMDFGCIYEGYCSDMTRTIVIGKATDKQKGIYNKVLEAQEAALAVIKAGLTGREVDKVARDIIYQAGYEGCFGHGLGHGVGLFIHESPRLSAMEDEILQPGMVETVEPGIYLKGYGGVRIEDMVVVTKTGYENFTFSEKKLIEL
ncbi:aminopeptidase P family protein [Mobilitalea sibirica]|uniref:Aminopeptidase P family protein n=1 Tax=Mobilitalea sibirica TaxID=1462919 RepID=A0A8J7HBN7_9FIRM|nr:aminopeptidase P family protein [Mobilitalea sibirica]MBH1940192.1 aminopeptidase P family protein [Mobilitalea sibirica]